MIEFRPVTGENFGECIKIETGISPELMAPVSVQIALSYVYPSKIPMAVYDEGRLIGFISYEKDSEPVEAYDILIIVIDRVLQGKGLGKRTLQKLIEYLFSLDDCDLITLNYDPSNTRAGNLYRSLGFVENGRSFGKEIVMELARGGYGKTTDL